MTKALKFKVGDLVKVSVDKRKTWMKHFETGFTGLVTVAKHGYFVSHPRAGMIGWYDEGDLTLVESRTDKSELQARRIAAGE
jgi:hypothetical protein